MGTLNDYFVSDCREVNVSHQLSIFSPDGVCIGQAITFRVHLLFEAHSKYLSVYSGDDVRLEAIFKLLEHPPLRSCDLTTLLGQGPEWEMIVSVRGGVPVSVKDLVFTRKLMIYVSLNLTVDEKRRLASHAMSNGFIAEIRDLTYAEERSRQDRPLAFISHAKSDSRKFAAELAGRLSGLGCPVWFDEFSLKVGDSLLESITRGLKSTDKCILVLSPDFLTNEGWCKFEFRTASMIQMVERRDVFMPVWRKVTKQQVFEYSPMLVDIVSIPSGLDVDVVATKLSEALLDQNRRRA